MHYIVDGDGEIKRLSCGSTTHERGRGSCRKLVIVDKWRSLPKIARHGSIGPIIPGHYDVVSCRFVVVSWCEQIPRPSVTNSLLCADSFWPCNNSFAS